MAGLGAEIVATLQEEALLYLEASIERVTGFDVPFPLHQLEEYYLPQPERIADTVRGVATFPAESATTGAN